MSRLAVTALAAAACSSSTGVAPVAEKPPEKPSECESAECLEIFRAHLRESPPDFAAADAFADASCKRGVELMCIRLARLHAVPVWSGSDPARALAGFETSCDRGHQRGCLGVGKIIMVHSELGEKSGGVKRALELFQSSCDAGLGEACYYFGMFHFMGRGVPQDRKKAVELLQKRADLLAKTCDAGNAWDCGLLAEVHVRGELFSDESFTPNPDPAKARTYAAKGCDGGDGGSCLILGQAVLSEDRTRAVDLFAEGCELLDAEACTELARHGAFPKERARLFARACALGGGVGCFALADAREQGGEDPQAQAEARALQKRGCELGYPPSCRYHANMLRAAHGGPKDAVAARGALVSVCQMIQRGTFCADAECVAAMTASCAEAGEMMKRGEGGPVDAARGAELLKLACERGATQACEKAE